MISGCFITWLGGDRCDQRTRGTSCKPRLKPAKHGAGTTGHDLNPSIIKVAYESCERERLRL